MKANENDISQRVTTLESDVAQMKVSAVTQTVVEQVLTYLGRLDSNLVGVREDVNQMKGDISRIANRVDRVEQNVTAMREEIQGMRNEFRHLREEL